MWLWSSGQGYFEDTVTCLLGTVYVDTSPTCSLALFQGISFFETMFIPHASIVGWRLYSPFLINIGISANLSLEISNLCSLHQSSIIWSAFCSVVKIAGREGPCITLLAKTAIFKFGALESSAIRSMMMFHKVGPDTDPCGQPLASRLELNELPTVTWAAWSLKKSLTVL